MKNFDTNPRAPYNFETQSAQNQSARGTHPNFFNQKNQRLILASASPARAKVLREAGIAFEVLVADIDEDAVLANVSALPFPNQVAHLAHKKAQSVAKDGFFTLACDSMFEFAGKLQGKPHTPEKALENILRYRGKSGILHTGHALVGAGTSDCVSTISTRVHFSDFTQDEARAYVATGESLEVAGSFAIDARGGAFIEHIEGDYASVVGVSVATLAQMLRDSGRSITEFWEN